MKAITMRPEIVDSVVACLNQFTQTFAGDKKLQAFQAAAFFCGIEYALLQVDATKYADHIETMRLVQTMLADEEAIEPALQAFQRVQGVVSQVVAQPKPSNPRFN